MARLHQNSFATNLTSGTTAGDTTSPLNSIPTIAAPFYLAFDATNKNGNYEVVDCTSKTATNVNHAATTKNHTTAEEVRCVCPAVEMDTWSAALDTTTWATWTPTLANWTVGANAVVAKYTQIGKTVHYRLYWKFGAGAAVGSGPTFTLPVTSVAYPATVVPMFRIGEASFYDSGIANYLGVAIWATTTTALLQSHYVSGVNTITGGVSATSPMTWAANDELAITGTYEAA